MSECEDLFTESQLFDSQITTNDEETSGEEVEDGFSQISMNGNTSPPSESGRVKNGERHRHRETLMRTSMSEERKRQFGDKYHEMYRKVKEVENMSDIIKSTHILKEQMEKQNQYFKSGGVNENMPLDAKCILTNSAISLQLVKRLQTDSKQFNAMEFAEKLLTALNPFQRIDRNDDESDGNPEITQNDWIEFGRKYCRFHKVVPTFHFIHGSFDSTLNEVQTKEKRPRARAQRPILSNVTEATQIDPKTKSKDESTPEEVELILKTVKKLEAKNKGSLPYIPVIVNPNSISQTVENIFHSAFLVKDGMARVVADDDTGAPYLETIDNNSQIDANADENGVQSVFSFTMNDWKYWIKKFDIKKAAIKHPQK